MSIHHHAEGCRYRLLGREGERRFKQLCQELGIPSWSRMLQPLVMVDGSLWAIGNHRVSAPFVEQVERVYFTNLFPRFTGNATEGVIPPG